VKSAILRTEPPGGLGNGSLATKGEIGFTSGVVVEAEPAGPNPTVAVAQGNHQFQAKLAMVDDTGITVASGASLDLNMRKTTNQFRTRQARQAHSANAQVEARSFPRVVHAKIETPRLGLYQTDDFGVIEIRAILGILFTGERTRICLTAQFFNAITKPFVVPLTRVNKAATAAAEAIEERESPKGTIVDCPWAYRALYRNLRYLHGTAMRTCGVTAIRDR
jgi:hypothetical protein